jgi:enoyl-CoA hydratase/carnithine racemase
VPSRGWHSETLRLMERLPKPVIAAVHGHCYTGALEVALAADFILAAESARFGDTHAKWALTPVWGMSQRLPRRVDVATAKRLMFTAEMISSAEAFRIGLAEKVVPDAEFEAAIEALGKQILANSPFSHAANKRLLEATDARDMDSGLQWEVLNCEGVGPDMQARIGAFMGKPKN